MMVVKESQLFGGVTARFQGGALLVLGAMRLFVARLLGHQVG